MQRKLRFWYLKNWQLRYWTRLRMVSNAAVNCRHPMKRHKIHWRYLVYSLTVWWSNIFCMQLNWHYLKRPVLIHVQNLIYHYLKWSPRRIQFGIYLKNSSMMNFCLWLQLVQNILTLYKLVKLSRNVIKIFCYTKNTIVWDLGHIMT